MEAHAPGRIDLAGGTLDIWPLYLFHEGASTINCAITRYVHCRIDAHRKSRAIVLRSLDTNRAERFSSFTALRRASRYRLPLLSRLVRFFEPRAGFTLTTDSEVPAGSGLGGSSALAVAICAALTRFTGARLNRLDWIRLSRDAEAIVLGVPTGTQDHYPAAFGGAAVIALEPGGERREDLRVELRELESRLVLCYTGKPRHSGINNWNIFQKHLNGNRRVRANLEKIAVIARSMRTALEAAQWNEAGRLMGQEWQFRRRNLPTISTPGIDRIISAACCKGALAGKVCGAGGGGCVVLLTPPSARLSVENAVVKAGGQLLPLRVDGSGVSVRRRG